MRGFGDDKEEDKKKMLKKVAEGERKRSPGWKEEREEGGQLYGCCYAEM